MKYLIEMAPTFWNGNRRERVRVLGAIGVQFALGAFLIACIQHYAGPYLTTDLTTGVAPVVGGAIAAIFVTALKSA